jgi:hypothetical protein
MKKVEDNQPEPEEVLDTQVLFEHLVREMKVAKPAS